MHLLAGTTPVKGTGRDVNTSYPNVLTCKTGFLRRLASAVVNVLSGDRDFN